MLAGQQVFRDAAEAFLLFLGDCELVAHNSAFDVAFLNNELALCGRRPLVNRVVDTLAIARICAAAWHAMRSRRSAQRYGHGVADDGMRHRALADCHRVA